MTRFLFLFITRHPPRCANHTRRRCNWSSVCSFALMTSRNFFPFCAASNSVNHPKSAPSSSSIWLLCPAPRYSSHLLAAVASSRVAGPAVCCLCSSSARESATNAASSHAPGAVAVASRGSAGSGRQCSAMSAAVIRRRGAMLSAMGSENAFDNACYFLVSRLCVVAEPVGQLRVGAFQ